MESTRDGDERALVDKDTLVVDLHLSSEALKRIYRGAAQEVVAHDRAGRVVRFPASILKPFVGHDGVHGSFLIRFDERRRFRGIERIRA